MKKKMVKKLRRIANQMPVINVVKRSESKTISGKDAIAEGITKLKDGSEIDADKKYSKSTPVIQPQNHLRAMKKLLKQKGIAGVNGYIQAVVNHTKKK